MAHPALELQFRRTLGNKDWTDKRLILPQEGQSLHLGQNNPFHQPRQGTNCLSTVHGGKDLDVTAEYEPTSVINAEKVATPWKSLIQKMNLSSSMWLR